MWTNEELFLLYNEVDQHNGVMLVKYHGAEPCSDLYTSTAILNRTRSAIRSQWKLIDASLIMFSTAQTENETSRLEASQIDSRKSGTRHCCKRLVASGQVTLPAVGRPVSRRNDGYCATGAAL